MSCFHFAPGGDRGLGTEHGVQSQHPWQGGHRGQPEDGGEPNAFYSSLSHVREFLPLAGGVRAKKPLWERGPFPPGFLAPGTFVLGLRMCGFSTPVFALFLLLILSSLPCSMLHGPFQHPKTGCHGTSSAGSSSLWVQRDLLGPQLGHFEPQPGTKQTQTGQGKDMSSLMVHQNHNFLVRHIPYLPKALHVTIAGVQRPPCQSPTHKNGLSMEKDLGPIFPWWLQWRLQSSQELENNLATLPCTSWF